jgi:hypothetical protein
MSFSGMFKDNSLPSDVEYTDEEHIFLKACEGGDSKLALEAIELGYTHDIGLYIGLRRAIMKNRKNVVEAILSNHQIDDKEKSSAIFLCKSFDRLDIAEVVLEKTNYEYFSEEEILDDEQHYEEAQKALQSNSFILGLSPEKTLIWLEMMKRWNRKKKLENV